MKKTHLQQANCNPWYILMTLYGEQTGNEIDRDLHRKNREAWNRWIDQSINSALREELQQADIALPRLNTAGHNEEVRRLYTAEFHKRNGLSLTLPQMPNPEGQINLTDIRFDNIFSCEGFGFRSTMAIANCEFQKTVDFSKTIFVEDASFSHSSFLGEFRVDGSYLRKRLKVQNTDFEAETSMSNCRCVSSVSFDRTTFSDGLYAGASEFSGFVRLDHCKINESTDFAGSKFARGADFGGCILTAATFQSAEFTMNANFLATVFTRGAVFGDTKFRGLAAFSGAIFSNGAVFSGASFERHSYFTGSSFSVSKAMYQDEVTFQDCTFLAPVSFKLAEFNNCYPTLTGVSLPDTASFSADDKLWPNSTDQTPEEIIETCATIRHCCARQSLPDEEHFFFRREMAAKSQTGHWLHRLPYSIFKVVSDYGFSVARPTLWIVAIWVLGVAAFWGFFAGCCAVQPSTDITRPFGTAVGLSFSNLFPVFGFRRVYFSEGFMVDLPASLIFFSSLQTVLSLPLLFCLGLGLRQRFRLK
ncbi:pentapeptide repeat-containing protein [Ruegeria arenilitoris]|uniref:pentapeptide repeat-containing protein n=1 Tax=Ruegeria arenilitoris TaxID=1173585 RepID=UPI0020C5ABD8|nr:hypothetical protein [Ruegeria arenilitoris]